MGIVFAVLPLATTSRFKAVWQHRPVIWPLTYVLQRVYSTNLQCSTFYFFTTLLFSQPKPLDLLYLPRGDLRHQKWSLCCSGTPLGKMTNLKAPAVWCHMSVGWGSEESSDLLLAPLLSALSGERKQSCVSNSCEGDLRPWTLYTESFYYKLKSIFQREKISIFVLQPTVEILERFAAIFLIWTFSKMTHYDFMT